MSEDFDWWELWPEGTASAEWSHSGIAVDRDGRTLLAAPEGGALVVLDAQGRETERIPVTLLEIHGISVDPVEPAVLWLADPGEKPRPADGYRVERRPGRAVALTPAGERDVPQPRHPAYSDRCWRPTAVVADAASIWVADGYGASLVHRFDRGGGHELTLDAASTGVALDCPHDVLVTLRDGEPRLIVADRGNRRLVRFDRSGEVVGVVEHELLTSPTGLAERGEEILVTELHGGLLAVDRADRVRSLLPQRAPRRRSAPWPNALERGRLVRPALEPGRLNSPHGVAVAADGSILLTEWLIGGRQWRLAPRPAPAAPGPRPSPPPPPRSGSRSR